jgi:signal transduction histidine kinase
MTATTLRRRLNRVLLQWFGLLLAAAAGILILFYGSLPRNAAADRHHLARTVARALDELVSHARQDAARVAADLPIDPPAAAARIHAFRFQSPFGFAGYLADASGRIIAADPADVVAAPRPLPSDREAVTGLVQISASERDSVVALVQPLVRDGQTYSLVAYLNPSANALGSFLKDLNDGSRFDLRVVDPADVVIAGGRPEGLRQPLPATGTGRVSASLRFAPWRVVLDEHPAAVLAAGPMRMAGFVVIAVALGAMGWVLTRTLSRSVVGPIRRLSRQAEIMRAGNLDQPVHVSGDREIEILARTLDEARLRLATTLGELRALNDSLEQQVAARTADIAARDAQRQGLVRRLLHATEDERRRLARELHDEIAQLLAVVQMSLHRVGIDSPDMRKAGELLIRTQQEIHRVIHDLRPSMLDDLGLESAMKAYAADHLSRQGLSVHLDIEEGLRASPEIETVIFRIYQELLTNVLRHADAERVSIELSRRDDRFVLDVEDDGRGFDPAARRDGAGITGMQERAALVNGTMAFDSEPDMGTHVRVEIPCL